MTTARATAPDRSDQPDRPRTVRRLATFAAIGVVSTLAYVVLYGSLRSVASAQVANLVALAVTAVANTTANRRLTFGVHGRDGFLADQLAGLAAFAIALGITSGAIGLLAIAAPDAPLPVEIVVVVSANVAATVVRFLVLRGWLDRAGPSHRAHVPQGAPR